MKKSIKKLKSSIKAKISRNSGEKRKIVIKKNKIRKSKKRKIISENFNIRKVVLKCDIFGFLQFDYQKNCFTFIKIFYINYKYT